MKYKRSTAANIPLERAEADVAAVLEQALDHQLSYEQIADQVRAMGPHRAAAFGSAALLGLVEATATAAGVMILAEQAAERPSPGRNAVTAAAGTPRRCRADLTQLTPSTRAAFLESQKRMARPTAAATHGTLRTR